ncbi:MAG: hypothetical protein AB7E73_11080 [Burkholderiales bacterium]
MHPVGASNVRKPGMSPCARCVKNKHRPHTHGPLPSQCIQQGKQKNESRAVKAIYFMQNGGPEVLQYGEQPRIALQLLRG